MPSTAASCCHAKRAVDAILLDAGGVILHPNFDWIAERLAEQTGIKLTRQQLLRGYYRTMLEVDQQQLPVAAPHGAALDSFPMRRWFFTRLLAHSGPTASLAPEAGEVLAHAAQARFPRESDIYHWAMPGTRTRLVRLRTAGFRLGVASNNDGALEAQLHSIGVRDLFEVCLDSGIEGVAKPDPELLWRAARALGVAPARCLFVGDVDRVNGAAARAAGMPFALLDPLLQMRGARAPFAVPDLPSLLEHFAHGGDD